MKARDIVEAETTVGTSKLPTKRLNAVYHLGTMNLKDRGANSYEGSGLSVALHPEEWQRIAKLGGRPKWLLKKPGGIFVDAHRLSGRQWSAVLAWGVANGYVQPSKAWKAIHTDEEGEEGYSLHSTEEEARAESDDVEEVDHYQPVKELAAGRSTSLLEIKDHLLAIYAEQAGFDGVWWEDEFGEYSAPRGVIVPSKISSWKATSDRSIP